MKSLVSALTVLFFVFANLALAEGDVTTTNKFVDTGGNLRMAPSEQPMSIMKQPSRVDDDNAWSNQATDKKSTETAAAPLNATPPSNTDKQGTPVNQTTTPPTAEPLQPVKNNTEVGQPSKELQQNTMPNEMKTQNTIDSTNQRSSN